MSKQTRKQKREEEKKILAEMDEAMQEQAREKEALSNEPESKSKIFGLFEDKTPERLHCRKCKTLMENGVCPTCGFRSYVPMDKKKQKTIRLIVGGICLVAFVILFVWMQTQ